MLSSVDTNILLRRITRDDPVQLEIAKAIFASDTVLIAHTVLLETAWVLRSFYKWSSARIAEAFESLLDLENVEIQEEAGVRWAIGRYASGADFADMLHVASSRPADRFITFDTKLAKQAGKTASIQIDTVESNQQ
jgi:predicted nucleic-acid-binding protein